VLVAVYGAGEALFMPAFSAIVPDVVSRDLLIEANSLENLVRPIAIRIVGPAIGGVTVSAWGPGEAFVIDAATFAVSGVAVLLMVPHPVESKGKATLSTAVAEIAEGFRFIRSRTWLWAGLAATAIGLLAFSGPWQVLVPFVVRNQMGGDAGDFALVLGAAGAGAIVASTVVGSRSIPRGPIVYIFGTWSIGTLLLAAMAPASSVWQAATVAFFILGLVTAGQIVWSTLQQTLVPRELLGRVASVDWFVSTSLIPVSFIVVGPLAEGVGADVALVGAGVLGAAGFIVFLLIPGTHDLTAVRGIE
ncbi:MAG: MFS transporter, partial [Actinomycetota bacterium]